MPFKKSPKAWFKRFRNAMMKNGCKQSQDNNHKLFVKHQGDKMSALIVYVDDIVVTRNNDTRIKNLKNQLSQSLKSRIWFF